MSIDLDAMEACARDLLMGGTLRLQQAGKDQTALIAALRAAPDARPDRDALGRIVREEWVRCATEHGDAPPHHLTPWEALDERNREIDRRIGAAVARAVAHPDARLREAAKRVTDETAVAYGQDSAVWCVYCGASLYCPEENEIAALKHTDDCAWAALRDALRGEGGTDGND